MHHSIPVELFAVLQKKKANSPGWGQFNKWIKCPRIRDRARKKTNTLHRAGSSGK